MKKLPMIKAPTITDIYTYKDIFPCFDRVKKIIEDELAGGNSIALIGDAGCMPDETYIMIDFALMPKCDYPELKTENWHGEEYKYFSVFDNKGAVCFNFYRLKEHKASSGNIELIIDRNSVCMGDDVQSHAVKYTFPADATYEDLFEKIISDRYLPNVAGNNGDRHAMYKDGWSEELKYCEYVEALGTENR